MIVTLSIATKDMLSLALLSPYAAGEDKKGRRLH